MHFLLIVILALETGKTPLPPPEETLARAARAYGDADFPRCELLCREVLAKKTPLREAALLLAGQCALYRGERLRALEYFTSLQKKFPKGPFSRLARFRAADCLWESGKQKKALDLYEKDEGEDLLSEPAPGLYRLAQAAAPEKFISLWTRLVQVRPLHPLAAWPELLRLDTAPPVRLLYLAGALHRARRWEEALRVIEAALERAPARLRPGLLLRRGLVNFDAKRYREAADDLGTARGTLRPGRERQEAWFFHSRALGRLGDGDGAIGGHLELVKDSPGGPFSPQALFFAGWLEQDRGRCDRAQEIFSRVSVEYAKSRLAEEAGWYSAWCDIRGEQWEKALGKLKDLSASGQKRTASRALYWQAAAELALGKREPANESVGRLCRQDPLGWYAQLARGRFGEEACPSPKKDDRDEPRPVTKDKLLEQVLLLKRAGLESWARQALWQGQDDFLRRHPGRDGKLRLAEAWLSQGDCAQTWRLGCLLAAGDGAPDERVLRLAFPDCHRGLAEQEAGGDGQMLAFLLAVMRTESGFDPAARSVADARGLMQLTVPVAERAASTLGLEIGPEDLFDPAINVRLASQVARELSRKYERRWWLMAADYNASGEAVARWLQTEAPLDRWVEEIPWEETRHYVKRIVQAMAVYLYLAGEPLPELDTSLWPQ